MRIRIKEIRKTQKRKAEAYKLRLKNAGKTAPKTARAPRKSEG